MSLWMSRCEMSDIQRDKRLVIYTDECDLTLDSSPWGMLHSIRDKRLMRLLYQISFVEFLAFDVWKAPTTTSHCNRLQHTLQHSATYCNTLQHNAVSCIRYVKGTHHFAKKPHTPLCCSVLQCIALCCSVCCSLLQCDEVPPFHSRAADTPTQQMHFWCSASQCVEVCCSAVQCDTVRCSALQCVAVRCSALQCVAVHCRALQFVAACCSAHHFAHEPHACRRRVDPSRNSDHGFCFETRCLDLWLCKCVCAAERYITMQCVTVRCSVLQCVAVQCGVLLCDAMCYRVLRCVAVNCRRVLFCLKRTVGSCGCADAFVLQCVAVCCSMLQCAAVRCSYYSLMQCVAMSLSVCSVSFWSALPTFVTVQVSLCCNQTCLMYSKTSSMSAGLICVYSYTQMFQNPHAMQHTATYCNILQHTALIWAYYVCIHTFRWQKSTHTATHCNTLQHTATHCNTLQHTATHCNTLQLSVLILCIFVD